MDAPAAARPTFSRAEPFRPEALTEPAELRDTLRRAGYVRENISKYCGEDDFLKDRPVLLRRAADESFPFDAAARLLFLGEPVSTKGLNALFSPALQAQLMAAGVVTPAEGGKWRSVARLTPLADKDQWVFSDFIDVMADDHVLQHGPPSELLDSLVPRRRFERALDLGCGGADQTLISSEHCGRIVATDISSRALSFARMNAHLNGIENAEFRQGSFFEPVAGEKFDLFMCNPPYVISPESERVFRTGELGGDGVSETVVRGAADTLNENGLAIILVNWCHQTAEDWAARPLEWVRGNGCDAWVMHYSLYNPLKYAASWLRTEVRNSEVYGRELDQWTDYLARIGAEFISAGVVILRRRDAGSAGNWVRTDLIVQAGRSVDDLGDFVERIIANETFLQAATSDEALYSEHFLLHPEHVVDASLVLNDGRWEDGPLILKPQPGLNFPGRVSRAILRLLEDCDGTRPFGEVIMRFAEANKMEPATAARGCLTMLRKFLAVGVVVPVNP